MLIGLRINNHWDTMAKFVTSNGFNVVEGGVEHLDICRKHGLDGASRRRSSDVGSCAKVKG